MFQAVADFFSSGDFLPHGHCFLWQADILWLHVISDAGIVAAYFSIPFVLLYFVRKRRDMPFPAVFILFGAFILLCGTTHFMNIWVLWYPDYAVEGVIKALTAMVSITTLFVTISLIPKALLMPNPSQLRSLNEELINANRKLEFASRELQYSSHYMKNILDHVVDPIFVKDAQHRWVDGNKALWELFGKSREEMIGKTDYDLFSKEDAVVLWQKDDEVLRTGKTGTNIDNFTDASGELHIISTKKACFKEPNGNLILVGIIRDITEIRQMQEKLEGINSETMSLLASIVEFSDDAIISKNLDGVVTSWNEGAHKLFGYSAGEALGRHISFLIPEGSLQEEFDIIAELRKGKSAHNFETVRCTKPGNVIDISITVSPIRDISGEITGISQVARDITERKNAEARQKQADLERHISDNRLRAVVDHTLDGLITINERGDVESFNPACERIFGYSATEVLGQNIKMLMPEPYHSGHDGYLSHYNKTGEAHIIGTAGREVSGKRKDGSVFPMDLSVSSFQLEDGRHFSGIIRDITVRKKAEETVKLLGSIVESSDDAIISKTVEGVVTSWNEGARKLFGYSASEALGSHISFLIPEDRLQEEADIITRLQEGKSTDHFETVRKTKSGNLVDISLTVSPIRDMSGNIIGASKVARDITYRKESEEKLFGYMRDLERSNKELDDFAYIASHDLKEPLRGLTNNAKFLQQDYKDKIDGDGVKRLQRLEYLCARMEQLVNDLLYFSRLGRQELAIQPTDMNLVVRDIELLLDTPDVTIEIPQKLPEIICDKLRITEMLRNLVTNAVKYNDKKNKIVKIGFEDEMVTPSGIEKQVFYVQDNGIGIEEEFFEEIFRIFKRLNEESDDKKGTGVGLTFVRKIVERHGGKIWLGSVPGEGTTFYFTIKQGINYGT